jgi:hypothetical protein
MVHHTAVNAAVPSGLREIALFAGAGGGILGGHLLGWKTVCAVEITPYAREVLFARQADGTLEPFPVWDDIRTFDGRAWRGYCDVVSGGFPCQDVSSAGKGAGIDGERSGLWGEMARVIGEVQPRWVWVENSPLLVSRGLVRVVRDLTTLGIVVRGDVWEPGKSVPRIVEIDSGSSEIVSAQSNVRVPWPTPMVTDAKNKGGKGQLRRKYPPLNAVVGIERSSKATEALAWPTPQSRDYKGAPGKGCVERGGHQSSLPMKIGQVTEALAWPTPRSCTATAATITEQAQQCAADRFPNLETVMVQREHGAVGGALNPAWVEWLMNWPVGWTNLKPIRGFNRWRRKTMESSWWARDPADEPDTKVPRISVGKLHRVDRLKAIGNGQVPLCCALAFLTLQRELLTFLKNHPSGR